MRTKEVLSGVYKVDLEPGGFSDLVSVYIVDSGIGLLVFEGGPSCSQSDLTMAVRSLGKPPTHVFLTHVHIDHYGAAGALVELNHDVQYYVHPRGAKVLPNPDIIWAPAKEAMGWLGELYGRPLEIPQKNIKVTEDGEEIQIGDVSVEVIHTPGHASHHQSFLVRPWDMLVVGDAAGIYVRSLDYIIPTTMEPLRLDLYIESIRRLLDMGPRYIAYTHHDLVGDAAGLLSRHLSQIEIWSKAAEEAARERLTPAELEGILVERDQSLRRVYSDLKGLRAHYHLFQMAISGLLNYYRNLGK
ncbi:MBL fold metallo-hydrolase [Thermoproteus tenax]|uniref:Metallo-beta-lactamase family protein n=1 Tax=Thermoproteus tenax (strain ATCC 35583 / DSM 2078 / JCM 9277 / NBRC 100435 / Kra 1) TaxID=768679 RepID=G4RKJ2_THETK|nr:MBL fold metallo-hydrolase [Thermoproteus tenax]CCC82087.1 metallo-beta-lactamase family protein [Thermoproteus tenax Kra 1]